MTNEVYVMVFVRFPNNYPFNENVELVWLGAKSCIVVIEKSHFINVRDFYFRYTSIAKNFFTEFQLIKPKR